MRGPGGAAIVPLLLVGAGAYLTDPGLEALEIQKGVRTAAGVPQDGGGVEHGLSLIHISVFPNGGVYRQARTYTKVENSKGEVILDNTREDSVAVKDTTAYYINSMLTNVVTSGGGTEARISGMTTAGKTGTTDTKDVYKRQGMRHDAWTGCRVGE